VRRSTSDVAVIVIKCAVGCCQVARHRRPTQSRPCTAVVDAPSVEPVDGTALRLLLPPMLLCFCFSCRCLILYLWVGSSQNKWDIINIIIICSISHIWDVCCTFCLHYYLFDYSFVIFTAGRSYASAVLGVVILSVCPSVCHTRALWLMQRICRRYFYTT